MSCEAVQTGMLAAEKAYNRAGIYRNASVLFSDAPSLEMLHELVDAATDAMSDEQANPMRESERFFYGYLRDRWHSCDEDARRAIASEYAELFVGPRPPLAPLYESVYLGFPNRLFTDQTLSVKRFYEQCGLAVVKDGRVPDDHMAYELELMARLAQREAEALENDDVDGACNARELERSFVVEHLSLWAGLFANRVSEADCSDFYAALSEFVHRFVDEDAAYLDGLCGNGLETVSEKTA